MSRFTTPTLISDTMCEFLGKEHGLKMKRTDVTRLINLYIRENNLQDTSITNKINHDDKLQTLFQLKLNDELTYFNIQKYMSPHFANMSIDSPNKFTDRLM
jgi:chromatin remodeling complex protein RSC6